MPLRDKLPSGSKLPSGHVRRQTLPGHNYRPDTYGDTHPEPNSCPDINTTRTRPEPSCPKTNTVVTRPGDPRMRKAPKGCTLKWLGAKNQAQARPAGTPVAPHKVQPTTPCPRGHLNTLKVLGKDISSPEVSTPSRVR